MENEVLRYAELARKIKEKSMAGQINWSKASFVSTFEAPLGPQGLVAIQMANPKPGETSNSYNLYFKNEIGETFYTLRDKDVRNVPDIKRLLQDIYSSAMTMHQKSRNGAALSNMENYLNNL